MIIDNQTNFLYLADKLPSKYPGFFTRFESLLNKHNVAYELLPQTKDIWAVDFMPVQLELNKYTQFRYFPSYLKTIKGLKTISDTELVCQSINIKPDNKSEIILDGGNLVHWSDKVIMTDRIFIENPTYERKELIESLRNALEIETIYFVPKQPGDFTGHADGMLRFIDENTVLVNDFSKEKDWFKRAFEIALHNAGLETITFPYNPYSNSNNTDGKGCYINYLQMKDIIFLPIYGMKEDEVAFKQIESIFPGYTIATINCNEIAKEGGVLNCISWNIQIE